MARWSVYDVGFLTPLANKEDLLDMITNIDPFATPFFSAAPKTTVKHKLHEWVTDTLAATSTAGAIEGADFSSSSDYGTRTRLQNLTQIFRKDIEVTDTQRAVDPVGVRDEYEYQVMKAMRELARNIESTIFKIASASATGATATNATVMKGVRGFAIQAVDASGTISTGAVASLHKRLYESGADPDTLYVSPGVKKDFVTAAITDGAANVRNIAAADQKLIANIEVFQGPQGLLAVVQDRFIPQASVTAASAAWFVGERSKARIGFLRPIQHVPIGKGGDATRGMVRGEMTLELLHPSAWGMGTGASTT